MRLRATSKPSKPIAATSASKWYETGPVRKPKREVFDEATKAVRRQGYAVSHPDADRSRIETDWLVLLSAHWRDGNQTKIEIDLLSDTAGGVNVRIRSLREINDNARNPLAAGEAEWLPAELDDRQGSMTPVPAIRLHQTLKLKFFGLNP